MQLSQKCQYGLRAVFELAKHYGREPVKIADIARVQAIPGRFLEVILGQLKQGGFVESRRGKAGGYLLTRSPDRVTVGEVIRFVEGPVGPVPCVDDDVQSGCPLRGRCVFIGLWRSVERAVSQVYDNTTLRDLVEEEKRLEATYVPSYAI